jgi:UDP-3-O-[3-hydroxymyristoyl] glucosamine N-acyltransferase
MTLRELAEALAIAYEGDDREIVGLGTLSGSGPDRLSFFENPKYLPLLAKTRAAAVLVAPEYADRVPENTVALVTQEPYLKLAEASAFFKPDLWREEAPEPTIGKGCKIAPGVSIGRGAKIGDRTQIMPGCVIGAGAQIGEDTLLYPNVTVYHDCVIGDRCIIHAGTVIGSDGYGFAHTREGEHVKLHQLGNVVVEDDVEIGANCTIDRAAFESTHIRRGVKIDNLVHIAHNCDIGPHTLLAGQTGVSGSTRLGRNVVMGGQSGTAGHLEVGDFAVIAARGGVTKSVPGKQTYAGFPLMPHKKWLKLNALLSRMAQSNDKGAKR